jgi:prefoldin subunit 5
MMATTPVTTGSSFNWKALIPILEGAGNIAELLIPGGAAFVPLTTSLENAVNPLLASIGSGNTATQEILAAYATMIGILTALQKNTKLDAATLAKVQAYLTAAQAGLTAYITAGSGYNPALYVQVAPIA